MPSISPHLAVFNVFVHPLKAASWWEGASQPGPTQPPGPCQPFRRTLLRLPPRGGDRNTGERAAGLPVLAPQHVGSASSARTNNMTLYDRVCEISV